MVNDMYEEAGVRGKTNHSMRASGATYLSVGGYALSYQTSLDSLRAYERISTSQHTEVSKVLMNNKTKSTSTSGMKSSTLADLSGITVNKCSIGQININLNQNAQK